MYWGGGYGGRAPAENKIFAPLFEKVDLLNNNKYLYNIKCYNIC